MGAIPNKYNNILNQHAIYRRNGYYVDSHIIHKIIELNLFMPFNIVEEFVKNCKIIITEDDIKQALNVTEIEDQKKCYVYEPLTYLKKYTSILKEKCNTLFEILEDLTKIKEGTISENGWSRLIDLDFHICDTGDLFIRDVERLADAIIYNVRDLYDKIIQGNNLKTYLTFNESLHQLMKDDISEIYPRKEVQIKDLHYCYNREFIALSDNQIKKLEQERLNRIKEDCSIDDEPKDIYTLNKKRKINNS